MHPSRTSNPLFPEHSHAAVLYSGGSDSTLAAALALQEFDKLHLLTFSRFGIFGVENAEVNVRKLEARYGANRAMDIYPAQMKPVIERMQGMYSHFGIDYRTPVFDYDGPSEMRFLSTGDEGGGDTGFWNKEDYVEDHVEDHVEDYVEDQDADLNSTDRKLYEMGIFDAPHTKGTSTDHSMQPRCFQFILFRIFVHWYYLPHRNYEDYEGNTVAFYDEKIGRFTELVQQHLDHPDASPLAKVL